MITKKGARRRTTDEVAAANPAWEEMAHTVRYREGLYTRIKLTADEVPMSVNEFVNQALEGILEMANTPEGQPMNAPRIVAMVRWLRTRPQVVVEAKVVK